MTANNTRKGFVREGYCPRCGAYIKGYEKCPVCKQVPIYLERRKT